MLYLPHSCHLWRKAKICHCYEHLVIFVQEQEAMLSGEDDTRLAAHFEILMIVVLTTRYLVIHTPGTTRILGFRALGTPSIYGDGGNKAGKRLTI